MIQLPDEVVAELLILLDANDRYLQVVARMVEFEYEPDFIEVERHRQLIKDVKHRLENEAKSS